MTSPEGDGWQPMKTIPPHFPVLIYGGNDDREPFISIGTYSPEASSRLRYVGHGINVEAGYHAQAWRWLPDPPDWRQMELWE